MSSPTISLSAASERTLRDLAERTGKAAQEILDEAIEAYRRKVFLDAVNAGYAALRSDPEAWAEHLEERRAWDATLMDGLDPDERWTEDGRALPPGEGKE